MMSAPSARWTSIASSGERKWDAPSIGDRNSTPSSVIRRSFARLQTWKPPESVRSAPSQPRKRWSPPSVRISSCPGRRNRWYVFASTSWAPAARRSSGARLLTAPRVPTGMKTGVSTTPWAVVRRPQRAAPSLATTSKRICLRPPSVAPASRTSLYQQTRVAVRVEAIARADRVRVRFQDQLTARKRCHEHEERRARQVEIRQQRVHDAEAIARRDVDPGIALERPDPSVRLRCTLEGARRRGPHREHAAPLGARPVHRIGDRRRNRHALRRQHVVLDRRRLDRAEGSRTDVQRELVDLEPALAQAVQEGGGEMQAGGRRRHRPRRPRVHRLITLAILRRRRPESLDVRRQRRGSPPTPPVPHPPRAGLHQPPAPPRHAAPA